MVTILKTLHRFYNGMILDLIFLQYDKRVDEI